MFKQIALTPQNTTSLSCRRVSPRSRSRGYNLIEVIIGMLILSIGILGMATMQISSKRLTYDALQRSIATTLIHDMIERMRANPKSLVFYNTNNLGSTKASSEPSPNCFSPNICTNHELAAHDLWEWQQALNGSSEQNEKAISVGGLINPRACITVVNGLMTVTIAWKGFQSLGNSSISNDCGEGQGLYGEEEAERQLVSLTTFINDEKNQ